MKKLTLLLLALSLSAVTSCCVDDTTYSDGSATAEQTDVEVHTEPGKADASEEASTDPETNVDPPPVPLPESDDTPFRPPVPDTTNIGLTVTSGSLADSTFERRSTHRPGVFIHILEFTATSDQGVFVTDLYFQDLRADNSAHDAQVDHLLLKDMEGNVIAQERPHQGNVHFALEGAQRIYVPLEEAVRAKIALTLHPLGEANVPCNEGRTMDFKFALYGLQAKYADSGQELEAFNGGPLRGNDKRALDAAPCGREAKFCTTD